MKMYYAARLVALLALSIGSTRITLAQNGDSTAADASLEELINLKAQTQASSLQQVLNENVAASSRKALSSRETPGIVSVITQEEIRYSGARNIVDLLRTVPGLDFAVDLGFVTGIAIRGNWASEGKMLVLVDGFEYNEALYQTVPFGNKFPLDQIARIEIIRGPGSAIYGGTAEYGVINIITKGAAGQEAISASGLYGALPGSYGHRNVGAAFSKALAGNIHADASFFKGQNTGSDQPYEYAYGAEGPELFDLKRHSHTDATNINAGLRYKNTRIRAIYDAYHLEHPKYLVDYEHLFASLRHDFRLNRKVQLTPSLTYSKQTPWETRDINVSEGVEAYHYRVNTQRVKANATLLYDISRKINLTAGGETIHDKAQNKVGDNYFGDGKNSVNYHLLSVFAQGLLKGRLANVTLGFRFDEHNVFGEAFVPRLAVTKRIDRFHFKALYSLSYRAPGIENMNLNASILPEHSNVAELELGYQFTPDMLLAVNTYRMRTKDVIIYTSEIVDGLYLEDYRNFSLTGSDGLEVVYKIQRPRWYANASYSYYHAAAHHTVDVYRVESKPNLFVAIPAHKIALNGSLKITQHLRLNPSLLYCTERYGTARTDADLNLVMVRFAPYTLANLFVSYDNLLVNGLDLGLGVNDLLNSRPPVLRGYQSEADLLPGRSREVFVKLMYHLSFKPTGSSAQK